ncbi:MAG: hypothetical protein JST11_09705 [Acidobacteria bacterium]|nr:hypothetical protein [Acidobacteriota bacterium]
MFKTILDAKWQKAFGKDHSPKIGVITGYNLRCREAVNAFIAFCEGPLSEKCLSGDDNYKKRASVVANVLKDSEKFTLEMLAKAAQGSDESKVLGELKKEFPSAKNFSQGLSHMPQVAAGHHAKMVHELTELRKHFKEEMDKPGTGANDPHQSLAQALAAAEKIAILDYRLELVKVFPWGAYHGEKSGVESNLTSQRQHHMGKAKAVGETHHM